jgi:hypothetical protein
MFDYTRSSHTLELNDASDFYKPATIKPGLIQMLLSGLPWDDNLIGLSFSMFVYK